MKIVSRPEETVIGNGQFTIKLDLEEIQLMCAYLYITRLGDGTYKQAAYKLMTSLEDTFGSDFFEEACELVDMQISRVDDDDGDTILEQFDNSSIVLEV